jgi:hypothetical protein
MIAIASRFLSGIWLKVAGFAAALAALAAVYAAVRKSGRDAERAAATAKILKDTETRNEVDRSVARLPDPTGELQQHWTRD